MESNNKNLTGKEQETGEDVQEERERDQMKEKERTEGSDSREDKTHATEKMEEKEVGQVRTQDMERIEGKGLRQERMQDTEILDTSLMPLPSVATRATPVLSPASRLGRYAVGSDDPESDIYIDAVGLDDVRDIRALEVPPDAASNSSTTSASGLDRKKKLEVSAEVLDNLPKDKRPNIKMDLVIFESTEKSEVEVPLCDLGSIMEVDAGGVLAQTIIRESEAVERHDHGVLCNKVGSPKFEIRAFDTDPDTYFEKRKADGTIPSADGPSWGNVSWTSTSDRGDRTVQDEQSKSKLTIIEDRVATADEVDIGLRISKKVQGKSLKPVKEFSDDEEVYAVEIPSESASATDDTR